MKGNYTQRIFISWKYQEVTTQANLMKISIGSWGKLTSDLLDE